MDRFSFNTKESVTDSRTVNHSDLVLAGSPLVKGGVLYSPSDIDNQHYVGICTGISDCQLNEKIAGKKYSPDFFYLLEKRLDGNFDEGSSILTSLKVANKIGFLPIELFTYLAESDRLLPYRDYIAKLQSIPESEVQRLIGLCVDRIAGYASVDVTDPQTIARAIVNSKAGILCRYSVDKNWYTSVSGVTSWNPADINPLRPPQGQAGGHAIVMSSFDYTSGFWQILSNTWGNIWNKQGCADINWDNYKPTEAWCVLDTPPALPAFQFRNDLSFSQTSPDIKQLQVFLNKNPLTQVAQTGAGSAGNETNYFGLLTLYALKRFQKLYGIPATGFCGIITRTKLNSLL